MMTKKVFIEGMSCGHCAGHVKGALEELEGVKSAEVSLEEKVATVDLSQEVDNDKIKEAIAELEFEVVKIEE